ncbi:PREDICTED: telomerase reverse transcriptase [Nanorana parkeri]|uniref:telomerase reverse transcriptase n=1 Tax=Nanorana parkeri TaxID=125878 RepID=UPI000854D957|nr:PREDICTED: telomerase reverse transcriptase [Nanorana parkeri]
MPCLDILHALYSDVFGIVDYIEELQKHSVERVIISQEEDTEQYRSFLTGLLVCIPWGAKEPPTPISFLQTSTQREVVARVIQRICEKKKKNVLAFGYGLAGEKNSFQVVFAPNICSYYPNSTTTTIGTSILWETLLSRVGDSVMMHLLENCSLFMFVPPTCCYQISGLPVYSLSTTDTVSPAWLKPSSSLYRSNILYQFIQKSTKSSKSHSFKTKSRIKRTSGKIIDTLSPVNCAKVGVPVHNSLVLHHPRTVGASATKSKREKRFSDFDACSSPNKKSRTELPLNKCNFDFTKESVNPALLLTSFSEKLNILKHNILETNTADAVFLSNHDVSQNASDVQRVVSTMPEKDGNICIDFSKLLYSRHVSKEGFLKTFLLNMLESNAKGSLNLIETVFLRASPFKENHTECHFQIMDRKKLPNRYWQMRHVFQELIQNHKKCPYSQLLKKCCNIRSDTAVSSMQNLVDVTTNIEQLNTWSVNESEVMMLLEKHNSVWQVYTFVRECLHRVVPETLWGSSHNKCRFLKNVKILIHSAKCEKMCLSELMWKMKVEDCFWLRLKKCYHFVPASEHLLREKILAEFLFWLMDTYVIQLLKAFFYITETMFQKNKLFFYRKCIWNKLETIGIWKHLTKLQLMSPDEIDNAQQKKNSLMISTLRFIPKKNGLRPIAKVCTTLEVQLRKEIIQKKIRHFNSQVKNLFGVLNFEISKSPEIMGSSVFGLDEIYKKWKHFVLGNQAPNAERAKFYFVKTDVKGAYETIPHSKLNEVITKVINPDIEEVYSIRRYAKLWIDPNGQIRKAFKQHVSTFIDFMPTMKSFLSHLQERNLVQNNIIVEQNLSLNESSSKLLSFLQELICNHILRIKKQYFVQRCGIPQGFMLSALLCSLCYGDMENKVFCGVQENGVLMRLSDDFLLVTTNLQKAKTFLRILAEGIPEYGCSISQYKTMVNFPIEDIPGCSEVQCLPAHTLFSWCGLLLDTKTLEVFSDYSRYSCTSIRSSLTFCYYKARGSALKNKLIKVLQLKCHSLILDLEINSLRTVCINVYKILLIQAYRFHACVLKLPFNQRVKNNPSFFLTVISEMAPCLYTIFKAKNKGFALKRKDAAVPFPFESAQWLCYHAFITKLSKHKALYKCLLGSLQYCKIQVTAKLREETTSLLRAVTHSSLHIDFTCIGD